MTTTQKPKVTYGRLSPQARDTIRWHLAGISTIAGYIRHYSGSGEWSGDDCGCVDDRCIGYHHDGRDGCECLPVWLDEYVAELST